MPAPPPGAGQPPNGHSTIGYAKWWRSPALALDLARRVLILTAAMLVAWALAAGTWRAWKTAAGALDAAVKASLPEDTLLRAMIVGAPFYVLGALGAVTLILIASALIGGAFGFLFGIPRMEPGQVVVAPRQTPPTPPTAGTSAPASGAAAAGPMPSADRSSATAQATTTPGQRIPFRPSPALNEIADWLTKIIVGLGLVQARDIGAGFRDIMFWLLKNAGLDRFPAAGAVVPACMIGGLIGGFLAAYLITTLVIGPEIADAADALDTEREALKRQAEEDRIDARLSREAAARFQGEAARAEADRANERARRLAVEAGERAQIASEWQSVDLQALLTDGAARPEVSPVARTFADRRLDPTWSVDERRAWAKINIALGRLEQGFEAYREATETP